MSNSVLAWHFASTQMRDGTPLAAPGGVERYTGKLEMCGSGLHASRLLIDALKYAPGTLLRRVECIDPVEGHDKMVARERRVLWECDMSAALRLFARRCALDVAHLWRRSMPDVVREFLMTGHNAEAAREAAEAAREAADAAEAWAATRAAEAAATRAAEAAEAWAAEAAEAAAEAEAWAAARAAREAEAEAWAAARAAREAEAEAAEAAAWAAAEAEAAELAAAELAAAEMKANQERRLIAYAQAARAGAFSR